MDVGGRLVFRSLWAGDEQALRSALPSVVDERPLATHESNYTIGPLVRGLGCFHEVLQQAGPRDMLLAAPPIAILGRIAGTFRRFAPDHRGIPAFLALIGTIGAIVGAAVAVVA